MARARSIGNVYAELSVKDKMTVGVSKARKSVAALGKDMARVGGIAAGTMAAGFAVFAKQSVDAASDMSETVSKSKTVFGDNADAMEAWASTASRTFGQSSLAALDSAATIGNMFVAMGMTTAKAAEMSRSMVELGSDLASFNNTSPEDAILAIGAALRGEAEPMRRYGVLLDDATLKAKAFAMGIYDGTGTLEPASKALAAYQVILDQTKTAQGDFAKTSDGLANSQRTLAALFEDAKVAAGEGLLPAMQQLVNTFKEIDFQEAGSALGTVAVEMLNIAEAIKMTIEQIPGMQKLGEMIITPNLSETDKAKAAAMAQSWVDEGDPTVWRGKGTGGNAAAVDPFALPPGAEEARRAEYRMSAPFQSGEKDRALIDELRRQTKVLEAAQLNGGLTW